MLSDPEPSLGSPVSLPVRRPSHVRAGNDAGGPGFPALRVIVRAGLGLLGLAFCLLSARAQEFADFGLFYHEFGLTLESGTRREGVGPFFYDQTSPGRHLWGVPPVMAYDLDTDVDTADLDILPPVIGYDRYGTESRWHLFQVISVAGGQNQEGTNSSRLTLFPFYFHQKSQDPRESYTAFFPVYGHLRNRLFRQEIDFVLFPLYARTTKRAKMSRLEQEPFFSLNARFARARAEDVTTYNYLYPIVHTRYGEKLRGWQVWPFYGTEQQDTITRTNDWGDVELKGGYSKHFALWPIYLEQKRDFDTANPQHVLAVLPLFSRLRSPLRDSFSAPWPIGYTVTDDRARNYKEWGAPWPLIVFARGAGKHTDRVFPFFSQSANTNLVSNWYLWPVYKFNRLHTEGLDRRRTRICFFLYSDVEERNLETGEHRNRHDLWPFFTHSRDMEGRTRLQILAPLEPFVPQQDSIEKVYSPLWSVWRAEKNPKTGAASQSLLWNLYRRDTTPQSRKCSLLFGLFQYQSGPEGRRVRLFYLPLSGKKKPAPASS